MNMKLLPAFLAACCLFAPDPAPVTAQTREGDPPAQEQEARNEYHNSTINNYYGYTTGALPGGQGDGRGGEGFAGTWRDPQTGDIITSVIAPRQPQQNQNAPVYIYPQGYGGCNSRGYEDDRGYGWHQGGRRHDYDGYRHDGHRRWRDLRDRGPDGRDYGRMGHGNGYHDGRYGRNGPPPRPPYTDWRGRGAPGPGHGYEPRPEMPPGRPR